MALGKPVLAANLGGPAESVSPESGITYNPQVPAELAEALAGLLRDPARRAALAAAAPARAQLFTVRKCVARIEQIYSQFLDS
jgi:glycosyltransferase involved in cell wall biosynthesis